MTRTTQTWQKWVMAWILLQKSTLRKEFLYHQSLLSSLDVSFTVKEILFVLNTVLISQATNNANSCIHSHFWFHISGENDQEINFVGILY